MGKIVISGLVIAALFSIPTMAAEECQVTYEEFEEHVPHVDLARCPKDEIKEEEGFCRLSFHGEKIVVYGFREKGDEHCLSWARVESIETFFK